MALAVDSFRLLCREIFATCSRLRNVFAFLGAIYATRRVAGITWRLYKTAKTHGFARASKARLSRSYGPWAVVTGSTHGIGKAYAQELAANGVNIVIVSIDEHDCTRAAKLLETTFGVQTHVIPVDFSGGRDVYDNIKRGLQGKEIGILVNNVGVMYDYPQYFLDVAEEKLWQLVHVNVAAATMMTHMILPDMVKRGKGAVVMVSSGVCRYPTPQMTVYAATKSYLEYFSKCLEYEYRPHGITVQCLMPFYVATRMTRYSSTLSNHSCWIPSATVYARHALYTLGWSSRTTGYWPHTVQMWLAGLLPEWLWVWGASGLNNALRRQAVERIRNRGNLVEQNSLDMVDS